jgi:16S rRNA (uracil1498-N3)-methyltransferase
LLIGPEGDFNSTEISTAMELGFLQTTLGQSRLRTETAALHACSIINFLNE